MGNPQELKIHRNYVIVGFACLLSIVGKIFQLSMTFCILPIIHGHSISETFLGMWSGDKGLNYHARATEFWNEGVLRHVDD